MSSSIVSMACACIRLMPLISSKGGSSNGSFGWGWRGMAAPGLGSADRTLPCVHAARTMSGHGRHPADHLRRRPRRRAARPLDVATPEEVPRPGAPRRARQRGLPLRGRRVLVREGRRGRRAVRLVALRRPRLPVPEAVGRDRLPRPRRHAHHVRRDPPRLLEAGRSASPTWTPTTSRRRSASPTRSPASAARRSTSAPTRTSRCSACRPTTTG